MRFARLFDRRDSAGRWTFDPERPRLTDPAERILVSEFLAGGVMITRITGRDDDLLDPARRHAVPMSTHTDGTWIWNAAVRYYLNEHGIAPEPDFLAHMAACRYVAATPADAVCRTALAELRAR